MPKEFPVSLTAEEIIAVRNKLEDGPYHVEHIHSAYEKIKQMEELLVHLKEVES